MPVNRSNQGRRVNNSRTISSTRFRAGGSGFSSHDGHTHSQVFNRTQIRAAKSKEQPQDPGVLPPSLPYDLQDSGMPNDKDIEDMVAEGDMALPISHEGGEMEGVARLASRIWSRQ